MILQTNTKLCLVCSEGLASKYHIIANKVSNIIDQGNIFPKRKIDHWSISLRATANNIIQIFSNLSAKTIFIFIHIVYIYTPRTTAQILISWHIFIAQFAFFIKNNLKNILTSNKIYYRISLNFYKVYSLFVYVLALVQVILLLGFQNLYNF